MLKLFFALLGIILLIKPEHGNCQPRRSNPAQFDTIKVFCVDSLLSGMPETMVTPALFNYMVKNNYEFSRKLIYFNLLKDDLPGLTLPASVPELKDNTLFYYKTKSDLGFHTVALLIIYRGIYGWPSLINVSRSGSFVYDGIPVSGPPSLVKLLKDRGCGCR